MSLIPRTDLRETEGGFVLFVDMPGVDEEGVSVTLDGDVLTIEGVAVEDPPAGYSLHTQTWAAGPYRRSFRVSEAVDGDAIRASMRQGVLRLDLPAGAPAGPRRIEINAG